MLDSLIQNARRRFDLTERSHQASVLRLAEALLDGRGEKGEILARASAPDAPLESRMAALLAESRRWMLDHVDLRLKVAIVFAMWGEQNRLRPKSLDNPAGEDSLATKLSQLAWATQGTEIEWQLYAVDDGCPHDSGRIARAILAEALPTNDGPLGKLGSADESRKGGAVLLGCAEALAAGADVVI
jgi:hypothetical protein